MAIKRIIGKQNNKYKSCLRCGQATEQKLWDDTVYTCQRCGQRHFVDVYRDRIVLTVVEYPDIRRRPANKVTPKQERARAALIVKVEEKRQAEYEAWIEKYEEWLEELAEMSEQEREVEFSLMDEEMLRRVKLYLEKRNKK